MFRIEIKRQNEDAFMAFDVLSESTVNQIAEDIIKKVLEDRRTCKSTGFVENKSGPSV